MDKDDWRLRGQEDYLKNKKLKLTKFEAQEGHSNHAHCEFCWHKFMENCENIADCSYEGYCTEDDKHWICEECYKDFVEFFKWEVI